MRRFSKESGMQENVQKKKKKETAHINGILFKGHAGESLNTI